VLVDDPAELLTLAMGHPRLAEAAARHLLDHRADPRARTYAWHALGIVLRDRGEVAEAARILGRGVRYAARHGFSDRQSDMSATLGHVLALLGRRKAALDALDLSVSQSTGHARAKALMRRAVVLRHLGSNDEALVDFRTALATFRRSGDAVWEARVRSNRAWLWWSQGRLARAEEDLRLAQSYYSDAGLEQDVAVVLQNRAWVARLRGDVPAALQLLQDSERAHERVGTWEPALLSDRAAALLDAGLAADALLLAEQAREALPARGGGLQERALVLVQVAVAALAVGDHELANARVMEAERAYRRLGDRDALVRTTLLRLRVAAEQTPGRTQVLRDLTRLLEEPGLPRDVHTEVNLLAGRLLAARRPQQALAHLQRTAAARRRPSPLDRAAGWHAAALIAECRRRRRDVLRACDAGLTVLDEYRLALGAAEARAAMTRHGTALAELGLRHASATGSPALLLSWAERWRATALSVPPVRPPADDELGRDLAALRDVARRVSDAQSEGTPTASLLREQERLERAIRDRALTAAGAGGVTTRLDVASLQAGLGRATLLEMVEIDGVLQVLVVDAGHVRQHVAGRAQDAAREVELARFSLHRLARQAPGRAGELMARSAAAALEPTGQRLEEVLLGPAADDLGDGPVVVVPPGRLHAVPWGLLPALRDRVVGVAPSAAVWLQGRGRRAPRAGEVVLVHGPDLGTGGAEVPALAGLWDDAQVLGGGSATAEAVLAAIDGAALAHLAAHGDFRTDNPMFSALRMDDGPLTVHDLGRLRRAPYRVVLSACESGLGTPTGADELLGLATALIPLGTAGLLASVVPVNDAATVPLMLTVHEHLRAGASLPQALLAARTAAAASDDPVAVATAAAFLALGSA
jgi:tetratricopeptide (TPR) repeat protein